VDIVIQTGTIIFIFFLFPAWSSWSWLFWHRHWEIWEFVTTSDLLFLLCFVKITNVLLQFSNLLLFNFHKILESALRFSKYFYVYLQLSFTVLYLYSKIRYYWFFNEIYFLSYFYLSIILPKLSSLSFFIYDSFSMSALSWVILISRDSISSVSFVNIVFLMKNVPALPYFLFSFYFSFSSKG